MFELCNYQRKVFGRINISLDNIYIYIYFFFFVEQPSKERSDILLSFMHSSLGENINISLDNIYIYIYFL